MAIDRVTGLVIKPLIPKEVAKLLPAVESMFRNEDPVALWHLVSVVSDWEYFVVAYDEASGMADGYQALFKPGRKRFSVRDYDELNEEIAMQIMEYDVDFVPAPLSELIAVHV